MTDLTSNREVIGHPARLPSNFKKAVISLDVCSLKPKENIYTEFLYYLMLSRNFSKLMASCASGTNVSHLSKSYIEGYDFIFPNNALLVQFNNFIQPMIMRQVTLNEESLALKQSRDQLLTEMI
jgi:restriction endonuclease S subunit